MEPIRQVVAASGGKRAVDESAGQSLHIGLGACRLLLREEHDGCHAIIRRIGEDAFCVGLHIANGDVQELLLGVRDLTAADCEKFLEPFRRNEVFVQDVGPVRVSVIQGGHRLV